MMESIIHGSGTTGILTDNNSMKLFDYSGQGTEKF